MPDGIEGRLAQRAQEEQENAARAREKADLWQEVTISFHDRISIVSSSDTTLCRCPQNVFSQKRFDDDRGVIHMI